MTLRSKDDTKCSKATTAGEENKTQPHYPRLSCIDSGIGDESYPFPTADSHIDEQSTSTTHPDPLLAARDFEVGGALGRGKFGRVYLARHLATNCICALKIVSKAQCEDQAAEKLIRRELEVHQNLAHRNILKLLSWFHDETSIYLVLEFTPGGSLYSKMKKLPKGRFDEPTTAHYVAQMAGALRYMHGKNIIHRDVKPEDILLGFHSEIKLADFGYSVHTESGFRSTVCGTLDYLSPEMALMMLKPGKTQDFYTKAIDQWSLGILTYELLVGKAPFEMKSDKATQRRIAKFTDQALKIPQHVSTGAEELIREVSCLDS